MEEDFNADKELENSKVETTFSYNYNSSLDILDNDKRATKRNQSNIDKI